MRLLLDSHVLLWAESQPGQLSPSSSSALVDPRNDLFLSPAVFWEIAIKVNLNKLTLAKPYPDFMNQAVRNLGLQFLPIEVEHAALLVNMPHHHRDPFDRLQIAQCLTEKMTIVSADKAFDQYGVSRLW